MSLTILPIRFGASARLTLLPNSKALLASSAKLLQEKSDDIWFLNIVWISNSFKIARYSVHRELEVATSNSDGSGALLIDLGGARYDEITDPNVFLGVLDFAKEALANDKFTRVFVVSPEDRSSEDSDYQLAMSLCQQANLNMIFLPKQGFGTRWRQLVDENGQVLSQLRELFGNHKITNTEILMSQVVRHVGRFKKPEASTAHPYFYDFTKCHSEVVVAIGDYLEKVVPLTGMTTPCIYFYPGMSDWFVEPVREALASAGLEANGFEVSHDSEVEFDSSTILLLPVVRSGDSVAGLLQETQNFPHTWCLANVVSEGRETDKSRNIVIDDGEAKRRLKIECCLTFNEGASDIINLWSKLDCPDSGFFPPPIDGSLSASSMWAMALVSGFETERYGPDHRSRVEFLPNFNQIVSENIGYIGRKLKVSCQEILGSPLPGGVVYLCVDEDCARLLAEEVSGSAYSRAIFVSRELVDLASKHNIDDFSAELAKSEAFQSELEELHKGIDALSKQLGGREKLDVVGFDEFVFSGSTVRGVERICHSLNVSLAAYITIASMRQVSVDTSCVLHSFYEFSYSP